LKNKHVPGTVNQYVSMDTQVLGAVLHNVVRNRYGSLSGYLQNKLWEKVGFEQDAYWLLDNEDDQMELAFGTINAVPRDFARFGWMYLNRGRSPLNGEQLVDSDWVHQSITPTETHVMPGYNNPASPDHPHGYGYQWWILGKEGDAHKELAGDYMALGVYNQFIYINPEHGLVITKNSAYHNYTNDLLESELRTISFFRTVASAVVAAEVEEQRTVK
jgi:CubicO group peptidase (beta-lactamase class C family)